MGCCSNTNNSDHSRFFSRRFIDEINSTNGNRCCGCGCGCSCGCGCGCGCGCSGGCSCDCGCGCSGGCSCDCGCDCCCNNQNQTVRLCFTNISTSGAPVSGSTFSLTSEGQIIDVATTDASGRACFTLEHFKNYQLRQTSVPLGYVLNTTIYNIFVDCSGNIFVNGALNTNLVITNDILV